MEETGLNQFILQPLRQAQLMRGSIPLRPMNPPRGPGKEGFLLRLQPFFSAGEVVFCGSRQKFEPLIKELLGFPYGHDDILNALAYVLEIKPGESVYPSFTSGHVIDIMPPVVVTMVVNIFSSTATENTRSRSSSRFTKSEYTSWPTGANHPRQVWSSVTAGVEDQERRDEDRGYR